MSGKFVYFELNKAVILFLTNNDGLDAMNRIFSNLLMSTISERGQVIQ